MNPISKFKTDIDKRAGEQLAKNSTDNSENAVTAVMPSLNHNDNDGENDKNDREDDTCRHSEILIDKGVLAPDDGMTGESESHGDCTGDIYYDIKKKEYVVHNKCKNRWKPLNKEQVTRRLRKKGYSKKADDGQDWMK